MIFPSKDKIYVFTAVFALAVIGYFLYSQSLGFTYLSEKHVTYLMLSKLWSLGFASLAILFIYIKRNSVNAPLYTVLSLSVYFVILYGILFISTEYGMHGHWGDNGNRFAYITKMIEYNTFFTDWYYKDLPGFYPPLWFYIMSLYSKMLGIEAYQTVKFGYLLIFLVYPWLLYFSWKKIVSHVTAAGITVGLLFFCFKYIDWIYYEHITAALFIPWWLYYFEGSFEKINDLKSNWKFYLFGGLFGALLFMTYYYWFFIAIVSLPFTFWYFNKVHRNKISILINLKHKAIIVFITMLFSSVYLVPLIRSIIKYGSESSQNVWFGMHHANLTGLWATFSLPVVIIVLGIFFLFYLYRTENYGHLILFFAGAIVLLLADRFMNMFDSSLQTRKILEFAHVFMLVPFVLGIMHYKKHSNLSNNLKNGLLGILILSVFISSNAHTKIEPKNFYKNAVNQRVPEAKLEIFKSVDYKNKVFLTPYYIEACYLPYYMFITYNNMSSHTAGRYSKREAFLDQAARIIEPELLAFVLKNNIYDKIDYIYLPLNKESGKYQMRLYQVKFNDPKGKLKKIDFEIKFSEFANYFIPTKSNLIFEVSSVEKSDAMEALLSAKYPDIYIHLD